METPTFGVVHLLERPKRASRSGKENQSEKGEMGGNCDKINKMYSKRAKTGTEYSKQADDEQDGPNSAKTGKMARKQPKWAAD